VAETERAYSCSGKLLHARHPWILNVEHGDGVFGESCDHFALGAERCLDSAELSRVRQSDAEHNTDGWRRHFHESCDFAFRACTHFSYEHVGVGFDSECSEWASHLVIERFL